MRSSPKGFTLVEIMIVVTIIALLAAIAIPNILRGRTTANESASIGNLRALISSLEMYRSVNNTYPGLLGLGFRNQMYGADCAAATAPNPDFGPPSFCLELTGTTGRVQGYDYVYTGVAGGATYTLIALPQTVGTTGTRGFFTDQTGLIRHCANGTVDAANVTANELTLDVAPNLCNNSAAT